MAKNENPKSHEWRFVAISGDGSENVQTKGTPQKEPSTNEDSAQIHKGDSRKANGFYAGEFIEIE